MITRAKTDFAKRIFADRVGNDYVYGGNWEPSDTGVGTDCSGLVIDICDAARNGTAMAWSRHGMSTETWRPIDVGQTGTIFNTVCVASPNDFPADAAVKIAIHHGPGGGANSHMWCEVDGVRMESNGDDGCITGPGARSVYDTSYANDWHYIPGPIGDADPRAAAIGALYDAVPVIDQDRAAQLVDAMVAGLALAQCNNPQRIAMFLAQTGEESDGFNTTQEYGIGQSYAPYIGRTWIQITWQANYSAFGRWAADQGLIDDPAYFVNNPTALADLKWAGIGAAWYWTVARPTINSLCDQGDVVGVTQLINGGQNGIDSRRARYQQAIALGDELLNLLPRKGPLMALTDDEQTELLQKTREVWDQLRGPNGAGWPQLGQRPDGSDLTVVDAIAAITKALTGVTVGGAVVSHLFGDKDA